MTTARQRIRDQLGKPDKIQVFRSRDRGPGLWWIACPWCGDESENYGVDANYTHRASIVDAQVHGRGVCDQ